MIWVFLWSLFGFWSAIIASRRGASAIGWFFGGFLLGPIGLAMAFFADPARRCQFCKEGIQNDAVRCPHCRSELTVSETKGGLSPWAVSLWLAITIAVVAIAISSSSRGIPLQSAFEKAPLPTSPPSEITLYNYNRIQDGMSYGQVTSLLGSPGEEMSRNSIAGFTTVMYVWHGDGIANMNAMFQNGKLVSKAQFGLK